jgi:hypothetical protein
MNSRPGRGNPIGLTGLAWTPGELQIGVRLAILVGLVGLSLIWVGNRATGRVKAGLQLGLAGLSRGRAKILNLGWVKPYPLNPVRVRWVNL